MTDLIACLKGVRNLFEVDPAAWFQPRDPAQAARALLSAAIVELGEGKAIRAAAVTRQGEVLRRLRKALAGLALTPEQAAAIEPASPVEPVGAQAARAILHLGALPVAAALVRELAQADAAMQRELLRCYEAATAFAAGPAAASSTASRPRVGGDKIIASLAAAQFATDGLRITSIQPVLGGYSKQTLVCEAEPAPAFGARFVVRAECGTAYEGASIADEFATAAALHAGGITVPRPLALSTASDGCHFMVMAWAEGAMLGWTPNVHDAALCRETGYQLGLVHALDVAAFAHVPGAGRSLRDQMLEDIALREARWRGAGGEEPVIAYAFVWLRDHVHLAEGPRSLVHGDFRGHNILQRDGKVTAILDWEHARIGNPALDLAYTRSFAEALCSWDLFLDGYRAAGGVVPDADTLRFHEVFASVFALAVLAEISQQYQGLPGQQLAGMASVVHRVPLELARLVALLDLG